jgi:poly(3-hydroxybutyrate) depolymerase
MAVQLSGPEEHRVMKAMAGKPGMAMGKEPTGANGDCGVDRVNSIAEGGRLRGGFRDYKVYVPSGAEGRALPLVVMLHGCTQHPDDFAVGTGMNRLAEERGIIVAYPGQPASANLFSTRRS